MKSAWKVPIRLSEKPRMARSKAPMPKAMKPTKKWKSLPKYAKFCDDESVEKDYAIKDATGARRYDRRSALGSRSALALTPKEQVETLGSTIYAGCLPDSKEQVAQKVWEPDDDERWEVLVLGYFWKNGRPKFKYIIIEKEVECKKDMPIFVNRSKAMM